MLIVPGKGFVFLAMTKAASTSIERAFIPYSNITLQRNPFKHTKYAGFQRYLQPYLTAQGYPRESYEVVCVIREPIDWLSSWWRYRSREEIADPSNSAHRNYAGHTSFEEFAYAFMKGKEKFARVGRPSRFIQPQPKKADQPVDRIFRYDRLDLLVDYLCDKVGKQVKVGVKNVSPKMTYSLSEECERELKTFLEPEYQIYEQAISG